MKTNCLMKKMMLEHLPSQTSYYPVRMIKKKSSPTMSGSIPLLPYSNCPHFILKEKVFENGSSTKIWKLMEQFFQWNESDITTNSIRNLHMLWKYLHHLVREAKELSTTGDPYSFMCPHQFCSLTWRAFMSWRLEDSNQNTCPTHSNGQRGYTQQDCRHESNQNAYQLLPFKKSIKREVSQYTILKDEKYFEVLSKTFQSLPQPMTVKKIWMEITNLKTIVTVKNSLNRRNTSCTVSTTKHSKVTWTKAQSENMHHLWMHNQYGGILSLTCPRHLKDSMKSIDYMHMYPQLSMTSHGKALLNNLFSTSMNNLDN